MLRHRSRASAEIGFFILHLFNVVLIGSGTAIIAICFLFDPPSASTIRDDVLPPHHVLKIIFYSLIASYCCLILVSLLSLATATCCSSGRREADVRITYSHGETHVLEVKRSDEDSDGNGSGIVSLAPSTPSARDWNASRDDGDRSPAPGRQSAASAGVSKADKEGRRRGRHHPHEDYSSDYETSISKSSESCFFCSLIFVLLLLFTVHLTLSFLGFLSATHLQGLLDDDPEKPFRDSLIFPTKSLHFLRNRRAAFDKIEQALRCCGLVNYSDYTISADGSVPPSCCLTPSSGCGERLHPSNIFYAGCASKIQETVSKELIKLSSLSLCLASVAAVALLLSCCSYVKLVSQRSRQPLL